jgi:hypothetical protein
LGYFVAEDLVIHQVRQGIEQVVALLALDLGQDHQVFRRFVKAISTDSPTIVQLRLFALFGAIQPLSNLVQLSIQLLMNLIVIIGLTVNFLLLVTDFN